ncbi:MAG: DUF1615 family protein [Gammaproteobacteria bacterium]
MWHEPASNGCCLRNWTTAPRGPPISLPPSKRWRYRQRRRTFALSSQSPEQESTFRANPTVPGLPAIARKEIDARAASHHIPGLLVSAALSMQSPQRCEL